jgi:hypothetical protein
MELVRIQVKGCTNAFSKERPNSLIFIKYSDDENFAELYMKDSVYARRDANMYFDEVQFFESIEIPGK